MKYLEIIGAVLVLLLALFMVENWGKPSTDALSDPVVTTPSDEVPGDVPFQKKPDDTSSNVVDLSGRGLSNVPKDLFSKTDTTELDLSYNKLSGALPAEVRHLGSLTWLDLSHNEFTGVPAEIGQLTDLQYLNLSYNKLTGLPYELGNLSNLEVLDLTGNDYSTADLAIIKKSLPASVEIRGEQTR